MRYIVLITSALFLFLHSGCESDLDIDIREGGGQLVMFSFLTVDSLLSVHLSRSVGHSSVDDFERVYDGYVAVSRNDVKVDSFDYPFRDLWAIRPQIDIRPGDLLEMRAGDSRGNIISGSAVIPEIVPIIRIDTAMISAVNAEGFMRKFLECQIVFSDPVDTDNYYQLIVKEETWDSNGNGYSRQLVNFIKDDPVFYIRDQEGSLLGGIDFMGTFSDYLINGEKEYRLMIRLPETYVKMAESGQKRKLSFFLLNQTKDYFDYIRSRVVAEYNYDLPIVDPIKIHSNINGGRGIIGGISVAVDSLLFVAPDYKL